MAHFGLPWLRLWDNRGKCHMDEKRIQCLSNASQHVAYPSIFNHFPVIQHAISKVRHFSTFLHILASPGYAPGIIAVNVTLQLEREFNACKTPRCIYPSTVSSTVSEIGYSKLLVENCDFFIPHLFLAAPQGVTPSEFREDIDIHKTRMNGLSCGGESMSICSAVLIQYQRVTDGQTSSL